MIFSLSCLKIVLENIKTKGINNKQISFDNDFVIVDLSIDQKKDKTIKEVTMIREEVAIEDTFARSIVVNSKNGKKYSRRL